MLVWRSRAKDFPQGHEWCVSGRRTRRPRGRGVRRSSGAMALYSRTLSRILSKVPGEKRLGIYRFLPVFFVMGAAMEWIMINMRVGRETFYDVYRRKESERRYQAQLATETSQSSGSD